VLANFRQADLGRAWKKHDEIMICPNMRAAQVYVQSPTRNNIERIVTTILQEPNVDQVVWRSRLTSGEPGYEVASPRGRLHFARGADPEHTALSRGADRTHTSCVDPFGGFWSWTGDPEVLSIRQEGRRVEFVDYPNAFERLAGALDLEKSGEIWVTARPGCEFEVPGGKAHAGGASHGALHALDSFSPVIIAGAGAPRALPTHMRSADLAPLCMSVLGIPMRYKLGDPRK
jgi:hypothetical protein